MEIWIVENEEKKGPFQTYEIRERIENKELSGEELAWHKDQDDWTALRKMDVFRSEFEEQDVEDAAPPPLPPQPLPLLRFFARWFDIFLYLLLVFTAIRISGQTILEAFSAESAFPFLYFLPFVIMEAVFLHQFKTTPGKFLLGLRVVAPDESALPLRFTMLRSLRAYVVGTGLMIMPLLTLLCHSYCLWHLLKWKEAPWDRIAGTKVRVVGPLLYPLLLFIMLFVIIIVLLSIVLLPTLTEIFLEVLELWKEQAAAG